MEDKVHLLLPEIVVFITTCVVMVLGLSKTRAIRQSCGLLSALGLIVAGLYALATTPPTNTALPYLASYGKVMVCAIGVLISLLISGTADRELESEVAKGGRFEPLRSFRGEYWALFLFSITGVMLCTSATDLIWLFLALELTSLPTYVLVAMSTARNRSMEAAVKYFFLGALGAAVFLYGFALIYGATGSTDFAVIRSVLSQQALLGGAPGINALAMLGLVLAIVGVCFKIAAVPMHFYTPDVYQGASASIAGMLAFVPKAAGFFSLMLLCSLVGWQFAGAGGVVGPNQHGQLPEILRVLLIVIAILTMTIGNVLAIMQSSVKRILAYSSIAHSGYMLVGLIAGPGILSSDFTRNGLAAILFYLLTYGIMSVGTFAVVASLRKRSADGSTVEPDHIDDFRGLVQTHPALGWTMVVCSMGLLGLPPLLGFFGKLPLFTAGIGAGEIPLVIILGINSAIAAYYYLRLAYVCFIEAPEHAPNAPHMELVNVTPRRVAGVVSMVGVIVLAIVGGKLADFATRGATHSPGYRSAPRLDQAGVTDPATSPAAAVVEQPRVAPRATAQ